MLQAELGSFYLPIYKREKVAGKSNAWDFVDNADCSPAAPTDPYVRDYRIRFLKYQVRFAHGTPNGSPQVEAVDNGPERD